MKIEYLGDHKNFVPILAKWYFEEWGFENPKNTLDRETEWLQTHLNKDKIPLTLIAIDKGELLGAAQLKYHEMSIYPEKEHWLGGVYVSKKHRGNRIAKQIITEIVSDAKKLGIATLYLQTENLSGGLYAQMGWIPIEQISHHEREVLIMKKDLS